MIGIFYNKNSLKDTLVIVLNDDKITNEVSNEKYIIGYNQKNEPSYINIFNFSSFKKLNQGFIRTTVDLIKTIKEITKIDLSTYVDCNNFKVGLVTSCEPINGTHLHVCNIDVKDKCLQIVCGAKNVRKDLKVVVATIDSILPNGLFIKPGELLGNKSYGMLCSSSELNLLNSNFNNSGIIELPDSYEIGSDFNEIFTK